MGIWEKEYYIMHINSKLCPIQLSFSFEIITKFWYIFVLAPIALQVYVLWVCLCLNCLLLQLVLYLISFFRWTDHHLINLWTKVKQYHFIILQRKRAYWNQFFALHYPICGLACLYNALLSRHDEFLSWW